MERKGGENQETERWGERGECGGGAQGADREMVWALIETKRQRQRLSWLII